MIRRTFDAQFLNSVANHPAVRPWLGGDPNEPIDYSGALANADHIGLEAEGSGGAIMVKLAPGLYEVHSQLLPERRASGIEIAREVLRYMFAETECLELVSKVPDGNTAALGLARAAGFREIYRRERVWDNGGLKAVSVSFQKLTLDDWRARDDQIADLGREFHAQLEHEKQAVGSTLPVHPDDEAHDRAVGAAILMAQRGNPHKAVVSYNRWACFAGYAPILLVSVNPPLLDIGDALLTLTRGRVEILLCREQPSEQEQA